MILWEKYCDAYAQFTASAVEGGSMAPQFYYSACETLTKEKMDSLQNQYAISLRIEKWG